MNSDGPHITQVACSPGEGGKVQERIRLFPVCVSMLNLNNVPKLVSVSQHCYLATVRIPFKILCGH